MIVELFGVVTEVTPCGPNWGLLLIGRFHLGEQLGEHPTALIFEQTLLLHAKPSATGIPLRGMCLLRRRQVFHDMVEVEQVAGYSPQRSIPAPDARSRQLHR